jgi:hypothetical protein
VDSLKKFAKGLFDLESSIGDDERFASMLNEDGDIHLWVNSETFYASAGQIFSMMNMQAVFKDNISATTMTFADGKITWDSRQYLGKEMSDLMKKNAPKPVSEELLNRIPSQNVIAAGAGNFPTAGWKDMLKVMGVDGLVNAGLGQVNTSLDEVLKAYNGDFVFAVSDFTVTKKEQTVEGTDYSYSSPTPEVKFLVALSVKDKASFDKLVGIAEQKIREEDPSALDKITYKSSTEWFAFGNSPEQVDQFLAGSGSKQAFASRIAGHPVGIYIDIQKILQATKPVTGAYSGTIDASMKMWQDVTITGGEFKDGYWGSVMEINLVDKKTNSLKQLNGYIDAMYAAVKNANTYEYEEDESVEMDTSAVVVPEVE